jgi:hypothetical protein
MPLRDYGFPWDDIVVEEAAQLAACLHPDNCLLHIVTIEPETVGTGRNTQRIYNLTTAKGKKIIWGTMPIQKNDSRKEYLMELARQYGSPDKVPDQKDVIDLTRFDTRTRNIQ